MSPHHQRIHDVFAGKWSDRIPVCEQAFASSVASELMGRKMQAGSTELHFEEALAWLNGDDAHNEFLAQVYEDWIALQRRLDWDLMLAPWRNSGRPSRRVDEYSILYGDPDGQEWDLFRFSPHSRTFSRVESGRPEPTCDEICERMRNDIKLGWENSCPAYIEELMVRASGEFADEYFLGAATGMGVPMEPAWLEATILEPELMADWFDLHVERQIHELNFWHSKGIRLINFGGDFAFNSGPIYSPKFFNDVMAPRWRKLYDHCRKLRMYCFQRSDGNLWPIADKLFGWAKPHGYYECDYDAGMHFDKLRNAFPELVLVGNVSCDLLVTGTAEQVRQRALECIRAAAPRVIISSANSILHGTPVENVLAMYDAAKTYTRDIL